MAWGACLPRLAGPGAYRPAGAALGAAGLRGLLVRVPGTWAAAVAVLLCACPRAHAAQYSLTFSKYTGSMSWSHRLPGWRYAVPVRLSAARDTTSMLSISANASMGSTLQERNGSKLWQDNASVNTQVNYPVLGPRAQIGIGGNMSVRNATLTRQKIRNQSLDFRFQYSPLERGAFRSLRVHVVPGLITGTRANRANLDSAFAETGIQYNASLSVSPEVQVSGRKLNTSVSLSKTDNTLTANKNRGEQFSTRLGYTFPGKVQTTLAASESRSRTGIPRRVGAPSEMDSVATQPDSVVVDLQDNRATSISSSVDFEVMGISLKNSASYTENLRTSTAADDPAPGNRRFANDREESDWSLQTSASRKLTEKLVGRTAVRFTTGEVRLLPVRLASGVRYRDPTSDKNDWGLKVDGSLDWQLAEDHRLAFGAWTELQTSANPGNRKLDRDVYRNSMRLSYNGTLRGGTGLTAEVTHYYAHTVNLDATQAGNNARNRDITLRASTRYERLGIGMSHAFSISARRVINDFDRQLYLSDELRKSNIRRGWSMAHSARRTLVGNLQVNGRYTYAADDFGRLMVERGSQVVQEDNAKHDVMVGMSYAPDRTLTTSASYGYTLDRKWSHGFGGRDLQRRTAFRTLRGSVGYNPGSANRLQVEGSRSRQTGGTYDSISVTYTRVL
ncbi:MAG: hypothetical protein AB1505_16720 [Candidatus Latescibacterota bacterium]